MKKGDHKEIYLNDAEGEEGVIFEYGNGRGDYKAYKSIEEIVRDEYDDDEDAEPVVPFEESNLSYTEYLARYGIDPDDVTAYLPIWQKKTLAYGFSETVMPEVQEDLSNHIFGKALIEPVYGSSFGHEAGDFKPMVAALRKLGEALLK